jgi:hypothetical protein
MLDGKIGAKPKDTGLHHEAQDAGGRRQDAAGIVCKRLLIQRRALHAGPALTQVPKHAKGMQGLAIATAFL